MIQNFNNIFEKNDVYHVEMIGATLLGIVRFSVKEPGHVGKLYAFAKLKWSYPIIGVLNCTIPATRRLFAGIKLNISMSEFGFMIG